MKAIILSVGNELITGQTIDTNSAWLASRLTSMGIKVFAHQTLGDDVDLLRDAIVRSLQRDHGEASITIITGGIGPTPDDRTREAISVALGQPLEENAEAMEQIKTLFQRMQRTMHDSNRFQAKIPVGCDVLENKRGTAPGIKYHKGDQFLFALPGVPAEMKEMFDQHIVPVIEKRSFQSCILTKKLQCYGMSEAKMGELLSDMMAHDRNPLIGTTAGEAVLSVRIVATGENKSQAEMLIEKDCAEIKRRLGIAVFGDDDDTLQQAVGQLLRDQQLTVSTAESCTGGLLGKYFTDVPGSSDYFLRGYITYSNTAKIELLGISADLIDSEGAVSEPIAREMAVRCREASKSDFALSLTGIAGPGGGNPPDKPVGLVYIALASSKGVDVRRMTFGQHLNRDEVRDRSCKTALNLLRHRLLRADTS